MTCDFAKGSIVSAEKKYIYINLNIYKLTSCKKI